MTERLGPPPAELPRLRTGELMELDHDSRVWRVYRRGGRHPGNWDGFRDWGPVPGGRFDHHPPPEGHHLPLGILYAAPQAEHRGGLTGLTTAVAEAFQETRTVDTGRDDPWLAGIWLGRPVTLLDLTSGWVTRAGGNAAISSGPRMPSQLWSRKIHATYPHIEGVFYPSSVWPPGRVVALYERARAALATHPVFHRSLSDPGLADVLRRIADQLDYDLVFR